MTDWLRRSRAVRTIEIDEGWSDDRDVSAFVGRWAWLDVRALVEEHGSGKSLVRVSMHLRPTTFGTVAALTLGAALLVGAVFGVALRYPLVGTIVACTTVLPFGRCGSWPCWAWETAGTAARAAMAARVLKRRRGCICFP